MQNKTYTITKKDLFDLLGRLAEEKRVIVPYSVKDRFHFAEFDSSKEGSIELGGIRQSQPVKSFINPARENILNGQKKDSRPLVLAGVKACDLSSFLVQDFVFQEGELKDPFYLENRNKTLIISCDCTYAKETCFCLAMDGAPYPKKYFDINLSPMGDYFLAEIASEKGKKIVEDFKAFFKNPSSKDAVLRDANRSRVSDEIRAHIAKRGTKNTSEIKGAVTKNYNLTDLWHDFASTCVECGACNLVCPTCHCFLLFDENTKGQNKRYRAWDACLYRSFARVAGGANPRKHLYERLRNRFDKKFAFFPEVLNYFACTGCGRCIDACPGNIDLREVLKGLVNGVWNKPPHK